jgi:thiamine-monophosphate kinase
MSACPFGLSVQNVTRHRGPVQLKIMRRERSEDLLIQRIARAFPSGSCAGRAGQDLVLGMGDDAAILAAPRSRQWVVSCDAFVEGVHFLPDLHPADSIAYKALARATSDLVAMGALPRLFLLALAFPKGRTGRWLDEFLRGLRRAARDLDMRLAGGDTTASSLISISVTVFGELEHRYARRRGHARAGRGTSHGGQALTRSRARPGDRIYVSGKLGRAQLGLELVRRGYVKHRRLAPILQPHLYPRLRVELGRWLAQNRVASAMMDLSDGLSSDLARLCRASRAGATLFSTQIPEASIPSTVSNLLLGAGTALNMALHGGDDYELLFTVPRRNIRRLRSAPGFSGLTCIGEVTRGRQILIVGAKGEARPLKPAGWDPFRQ